MNIWSNINYSNLINCKQSKLGILLNYFSSTNFSNSFVTDEFLLAKLVIKVKWSSSGITWKAAYIDVIKSKPIAIRKLIKVK